MNGQVLPALTLLFAAATLVACRDGGNKLTRPSFDAVSSDTGGGGCGPGNCVFRTSGASANASWFVFSPGPDTGGSSTREFGSINVSRGGSSSDPQVFLSFDITRCDQFSCFTVRGGFGTIPAGDLSGNGNALHLNTNTTGNPNFFTYAGPTGVVAVDWEANGLFQSSFRGTSTFSTPSFREHASGYSENVSATASGLIVGMNIPTPNNASIATNRDMRISVSH